MTQRIGLPQARRIALAATGLAAPRPDAATPGAMRRTVARLGLLQIDSVSVLARAHYLPLFSRLGAYDRAWLEAQAWGRRPSLFEYWAHEASLLPHAAWPLLRWRMDRAAAGQGTYGELARFAAEQRPFIDAVLARVRAEGALAASDLEGERGTGGWWGWSGGKRALEWLFWSGAVTARTRRASFERVYDLPERVLPAAVLAAPVPSEAEAHRALLAMAGRALGIGTAADLRDYYRLSPAACAVPLAELVEAGDLLPVAVEGWKQPAYVHRDARWPRRVDAACLLSPFDPLVWERSRTERLFAFRYRLEIYTPAHKREHGYYVLPFLLGDHLVARVDLKAARADGELRVLSAHAEPHAAPETAERLMAELRVMAGWLGLERVVAAGPGDLTAALGNLAGNPALNPQEDRSMADTHTPTPETSNPEKDPAANAKNDREVAAMTRTVQPKSDAPSRSGITGAGSGADSKQR